MEISSGSLDNVFSLFIVAHSQLGRPGTALGKLYVSNFPPPIIHYPSVSTFILSAPPSISAEPLPF